MIINKIDKYLEENDVTIAELSSGTGISRSTLYNLTSGNSRGIQYDTLNKLCMYFDTNISSFIEFLNFDLEILDSSHKIERKNIKINRDGIEYTFDISKLSESIGIKANMNVVKSNVKIRVSDSTLEEDVNIELITNIDSSNKYEYISIMPIYKNEEGNNLIVEMQEDEGVEEYINASLEDYLINDENYKIIIKETFNKNVTKENIDLKWDLFAIQYELELYNM